MRYEYEKEPLTDIKDVIRFLKQSPQNPYYDFDTDYTTNSPSYYDYLAKLKPLIQILAERIYDYDRELAKRFEEWDKNLEELPDELKRMFLEWVDDGTLARILAQLLLDDYATKEEVNDLLNALENDLNINLSNFKNEVNNALEDMNEHINNELEDMNETINDTFFHDDITTVEYKGTGLLYYVTTIPTIDKNGSKIYLEKGLANNSFNTGGETSVNHAIKNKTSLTINASIFDVNSSFIKGIHIKDSNILKSNNDTDSYVLGYNKNTQELKAYPPNITASDMINDGITDSWTGFYPVIENYEKVPESVWNSSDNSLIKNPRQVIAQMNDKTIKIFTFRGREDDYLGVTYLEMQDILISHGVKFAYNLDGGGSTSSVKNGILLNPPIDRNFGDLREVPDFINVIKPTKKPYEDIYKTISELSLIMKKIEARNISKYGDEVPGKLNFNDHQYLKVNKALYGRKSESEVSRILGLYDNGIYLGNFNDNFTLFTNNTIPKVRLDDNEDNHYFMYITPHIVEWETPTLLNNWKQKEQRNIKYCNISDFQTYITGGAYFGDTGSSKPIFLLPTALRPKNNIIIPCSVISSPDLKQVNVAIYTNGNVFILDNIDSTSITEKTFIQIEHTFINRQQN